MSADTTEGWRPTVRHAFELMVHRAKQRGGFTTGPAYEAWQVYLDHWGGLQENYAGSLCSVHTFDQLVNVSRISEDEAKTIVAAFKLFFADTL